MSLVPAALRRAQIVERIRREGGITLAEVARDHGISNMTAHRDLEHLADEGLVERVRGGARAISGEQEPAPHPTAWSQRVQQAGAAKAAIAAEAATMVTAGSTIFLDASSTALALARQLVEQPPIELTLVTNSPAIAYEILAEQLHVVVCPGELDQHTRTIAGVWTVDFLHQLHLDMAFVSSAGITLAAGLTTSRRPLADVLTAAHAVAARTVGLIDASKFGRTSLVSVLPAQSLNAIVSDGSLDTDTEQAFLGDGVPLRVAGRSS